MQSGRGFPNGRGAAEEVINSMISNMNLPIVAVVVAVGEGGNLLMDDIIPWDLACVLSTCWGTEEVGWKE